MIEKYHRGLPRIAGFAAARSLCVGVVAATAFLPAWAELPIEEKMSSAVVADFEFDWGRDGQYCPDCNFGAGNARVSFIDRRMQLWVGGIDHDTGEFIPKNLRGTLVDTNVPFLTDFGNGATWMVSQRGSQLVYSRYFDGMPPVPENAAVAISSMEAGKWTSAYMPDCDGCIVPKGTYYAADAAPRMTYGKADRYTVYWREAVFPSQEVRIPFIDPYQGLSLRWVDGTHDVIFAAPAAPDADGVVYTQVFRYNTDSRIDPPEQMTFDPTNKRMAFMWRAPEFKNSMVFFTVAEGDRMQFYRKIPDANGELRWTMYNQIFGPTPIPYIGGSPEAFTYNGRSWIIIALRENPDWNDFTKPTQLAITGIDAGLTSFRLLTNDTTEPRWRSDPEYFITSKTAYVYYTRIIPKKEGGIPLHQGIWRMDLGLGPPQNLRRASQP